MARRYWAKIDGRKVFRDTLKEAKAFAQKTADRIGEAVQLGYDELDPPRVMKRNPDPGSYVQHWGETEKHRAGRLDFLAATKARRLAKGLRGRAGKVHQAEAGAVKTGKFVVIAKNSRETLTRHRPNRAAADALGGHFEAAGYKVTIKPV